MGRKRAERPRRLEEKLRAVRSGLKLTQLQMYELLEKQGASLHPGYISLYETGERIPSLLVLLCYARVGGITMESLIDDELDLPKKFAVVRH